MSRIRLTSRTLSKERARSATLPPWLWAMTRQGTSGCWLNRFASLRAASPRSSRELRPVHRNGGSSTGRFPPCSKILRSCCEKKDRLSNQRGEILRRFLLTNRRNERKKWGLQRKKPRAHV